MGWITKLYVIKLTMPKEKYNKSLSLEDIKEYLDIRPYDKSYEDYVKLGLLYFTENLDVLAKELNVDEIVPMGLFIRGIYGGEKKKGEERYAGLILTEHRLDREIFKFRFHNTSTTLVVPVSYLDKYGIGVYKMIYVGEINPFKITRYLELILSRRGEEALKEFLRNALKLNERDISREDYEKIKMLISELQQPNTIATLDTGKYYVVYRRVRAFTASVFKPPDESFIIKDEVGYIKCSNESIAYYYAALLNYLAFKVIETKRSFNRTQYARPVLAIHISGLSWNNVGDEVRRRVISLSKELHRKAPDKDYPNQRVALKDLERYSEFKKLVELLDSKVDRENLDKALDMVSGGGAEEE